MVFVKFLTVKSLKCSRDVRLDWRLSFNLSYVNLATGASDTLVYLIVMLSKSVFGENGTQSPGELPSSESTIHPSKNPNSLAPTDTAAARASRPVSSTFGQSQPLSAGVVDEPKPDVPFAALKSFMAGAISGAIAKTAVAPFDRFVYCCLLFLKNSFIVLYS